jgi:hypothetical protein
MFTAPLLKKASFTYGSRDTEPLQVAISTVDLGKLEITVVCLRGGGELAGTLRTYGTQSHLLHPLTAVCVAKRRMSALFHGRLEGTTDDPNSETELLEMKRIYLKVCLKIDNFTANSL